MKKILITIAIIFIFPIHTFAYKYPLIIDTDAGWDDWIAISYLIKKEPKSNYKIIGIVSNGIGESHLREGRNNIKKITLLSGRPDIPVYLGEEKPLKGNHHFPKKFRKSVDNMFNLHLPDNNQENPTISGIEFIKKSLTKFHNVKILAIGGLTDIAKVIQENSSLISNINSIYVMGGSFDFKNFNKHKMQLPRGNIQDFQPTEYPDYNISEWNIFLDPVAAKIIFSKLKNKIFLTPLNVTKEIPLTLDIINKINQKSSLAKFIRAVLNERYRDSIKNNYQEYFYDAITAVLLAQNKYVTYRDINVNIIDNLNSNKSGATLLIHGNRKNAKVPYLINKKMIYKELISIYD